MYFIDKESDLIGKEIAFVDFSRFGEAMTIVTKDKGIVVFTKDDEETAIYSKGAARRYIYQEGYVRKELNKLGIITDKEIKEYEDGLEKERKKQAEEYKKQQEENEYRQYLRLKEKYENRG
jgi:molybdopterin-guanine dinucleotide biosynthesis protein